MQMASSWDSRFTKKDVMRNLLVMLMAVRAAYSGRIDLTQEWEAARGLVEELAARAPRPRGT